MIVLDKMEEQRFFENASLVLEIGQRGRQHRNFGLVRVTRARDNSALLVCEAIQRLSKLDAFASCGQLGKARLKLCGVGDTVSEFPVKLVFSVLEQAVVQTRRRAL